MCLRLTTVLLVIIYTIFLLLHKKQMQSIFIDELLMRFLIKPQKVPCQTTVLITSLHIKNINPRTILTAVESLDAKVISRLPFKPTRAGMRINISVIVLNTIQCYGKGKGGNVNPLPYQAQATCTCVSWRTWHEASSTTLNSTCSLSNLASQQCL